MDSVDAAYFWHDGDLASDPVALLVLTVLSQDYQEYLRYYDDPPTCAI